MQEGKKTVLFRGCTHVENARWGKGGQQREELKTQGNDLANENIVDMFAL